MNHISKENLDLLFKYALEAKETSYSPYSKFRVGAALLTKDGTWYKGCNVENASYGAAICAERTAYCKAISEGHREFIALAVSTDQDDFVSPCGICRQFISEFGPGSLPVYLLNTKGEFKLITLSELLPLSFSLEQGQKFLIK
ncbi:cytidine deaminase [Halteromyces radiatus]|uniref:cytidine deaminase n=1 Tax=Halteromyces radiatus TaxID=101107 RepID=UPI00221EB38B|nr:cytidine deaminase [Halteromyces radiatus]KAI8093614.1 cytidine deaminase [Halteromyces radiatus]